MTRPAGSGLDRRQRCGFGDLSRRPCTLPSGDGSLPHGCVRYRGAGEGIRPAAEGRDASASRPSIRPGRPGSAPQLTTAFAQIRSRRTRSLERVDRPDQRLPRLRFDVEQVAPIAAPIAWSRRPDATREDRHDRRSSHANPTLRSRRACMVVEAPTRSWGAPFDERWFRVLRRGL